MDGWARAWICRRWKERSYNGWQNRDKRRGDVDKREQEREVEIHCSSSTGTDVCSNTDACLKTTVHTGSLITQWLYSSSISLPSRAADGVCNMITAYNQSWPNALKPHSLPGKSTICSREGLSLHSSTYKRVDEQRPQSASVEVQTCGCRSPTQWRVLHFLFPLEAFQPVLPATGWKSVTTVWDKDLQTPKMLK